MVYFVKEGDNANATVTDRHGNHFKLGNKQMIVEVLLQVIAELGIVPGGGGTALTQIVIAADGEIVAAPNTRLVIPEGVLSDGRTIDLTALATDGDYIEIYMLAYSARVFFKPGTVIHTYGTEVINVADPLEITTYKITLVNGELRQ